MKLRLWILTGLILIYCCLPAKAENLPDVNHNPVETIQSIESPIKSYFLNVLAGGTRQSIHLDLPATRVILYIQQGEMAIRCGDGMKIYECVPGKPLKITVNSATPIERIWVENPYQKPVRLRLDILEDVRYEEVEIEVKQNDPA